MIMNARVGQEVDRKCWMVSGIILES
jgi:hypothetical protein